MNFIKLNGIRYNIVSEITDITLRQHIDFMLLEKNDMPSILKDVTSGKVEPKSVTKKEMAVIYLYFRKVIAHFSNIPIDAIKNINLQDLNILYKVILDSYKNFEYIETSIVPIKLEDGTIENWAIRSSLMREDTLEEFLEAANFEQQLSDLKIGNFQSLAHVMTILVRPKNEAYDEETSSSRVELMLNQNMFVAMQTAFFLTKRNLRYIKILNLHFPQTQI